MWIGAGVAALYVLQFAIHRILHRRQQLGRVSRLRAEALVWCARGGTTWIAFALIFARRHADGWARLTFELVLSILYVLALLGAGAWLARWLGLAEPAPAQLRALANECARRVGVRLRAVDVWPSRAANAYAFVWSRRIAFSSRALELLDSDELEGVLLHELGHLAETWQLRAKRLVPKLVVLAAVLAFPAVSPSAVSIELTLVGVLLLITWAHAFQRKAEVEADLHATENTTSAAAYARALEKLHEANLSPVVMGGRSTHPDLYDRMIAAGVQPSYARPAAPDRRRFQLIVLALMLMAVIPLAVWSARSSRSNPAAGEGWAVARAALSADPSIAMADLGSLRLQQERLPEAILFYRAASELDAHDSGVAASLAVALVRSGDIVQARVALAEAERRSRAADADNGWRRAARRDALTDAQSEVGRAVERAQLR